jgi:hypothetical protein
VKLKRQLPTQKETKEAMRMSAESAVRHEIDLKNREK